ncbi:hypothetical protein JRI60_43660 [Archangium violaceum]|uniref:hypothetical protein n=1 Tax=Archangium violaceum TaxID=83451 RepID=UPI00194F0822|nr:hypothetical protein [Archangium violaceum]QRN95873.1 hypothetical protein JRI60_43660 [Archangium violaceum]
MFRMGVLAAFIVAITTGCATGSRAYMDSGLANRAEPASVWNRPQEVGFDWGPEITGQASYQCVLLLICWGAEDGGALDSVGSFVGSILGRGGAVTDPLVRAAAANAVKNAPKTDGIYVVAHDTDAFNIIIYKKRTASVRGKAITVRAIGEVSQDRSDRNRNLSALGGSLVNVGEVK